MLSSSLGIKIAIWTIISFYGWFALVALVHEPKQMPYQLSSVNSGDKREAITHKREAITHKREVESYKFAGRNVKLSDNDLAAIYLSDNDALIDTMMCAEQIDFSTCYGLYGED
jgi:hypothetical protein